MNGTTDLAHLARGLPQTAAARAPRRAFAPPHGSHHNENDNNNADNIPPVNMPLATRYPSMGLKLAVLYVNRGGVSGFDFEKNLSVRWMCVIDMFVCGVSKKYFYLVLLSFIAFGDFFIMFVS